MKLSKLRLESDQLLFLQGDLETVAETVGIPLEELVPQMDFDLLLEDLGPDPETFRGWYICLRDMMELYQRVRQDVLEAYEEEDEELQQSIWLTHVYVLMTKTMLVADSHEYLDEVIKKLEGPT